MDSVSDGSAGALGPTSQDEEDFQRATCGFDIPLSRVLYLTRWKISEINLRLESTFNLRLSPARILTVTVMTCRSGSLKLLMKKIYTSEGIDGRQIPLCL
ncbi:hypothetical protein TNIN_496711 [Trichonephila inaurata madagascariensis]|uniref:Uncharacterized protein n=1 Tax=Trichonephila inaurata madagascariensis TaxID=2747483 RepID=A0A8X7BQU0_9ARAC|nr:hypothetical protein TNIN_496711 [Trichonephila inaurata madagascariensis]